MWDLLKKTVYKWVGEGSFEHAAALAFATLFSMAPILIILIALGTTFFGQEAVEGRLFEQIHHFIGTEGAAAIQGILRKATVEKQSTATALSLFLTFFGASRAFAQMKSSLNQIWSVQPEPAVNDLVYFLKTRLLSIAMVVAIGFLLLVLMLLSAALSYFGESWSLFLSLPSWSLSLFNLIFSTALITLLFAMTYKILPDIRIRWRDVLLGAGITAVLFTAGKALIAYYLAESGIGSIYGAAGSLVVLMLWIYYSALIFFFGAALIRVYTQKWRIRVTPSPRAAWVQREFVDNSSINH